MYMTFYIMWLLPCRNCLLATFSHLHYLMNLQWSDFFSTTMKYGTEPLFMGGFGWTKRKFRSLTETRQTQLAELWVWGGGALLYWSEPLQICESVKTSHPKSMVSRPIRCTWSYNVFCWHVNKKDSFLLENSLLLITSPVKFEGIWVPHDHVHLTSWQMATISLITFATVYKENTPQNIRIQNMFLKTSLNSKVQISIL